MEKNVFDVIKRLCGYLYLNNNSTQEERENFPMLEPFMLGYCFDIMANLPTEVIKRDDIVELIYTLFNNYRYTVRFNDIVPINIMDLFICFSENMLSDERIYNFLTSPEKKILFNCVKFYVKNKVCYVKVMQLLINIFDVKNLDEIENVKNETKEYRNRNMDELNYDKENINNNDANDVKENNLKPKINNVKQYMQKYYYSSGNNNYNYNNKLVQKEDQIVEENNELAEFLICAAKYTK